MMDHKLSDDLQRFAREAEKEDKEYREACEALSKFPPWLVYRNALNRRIETLGMSVLSPLDSVLGVTKAEYDKGTMYGLILARDLVEVSVQEMNAARQTDGEGDDE